MGLYFTLIPLWGWKGAVAGTVIAEAALVVAAWVALVKAQRKSDRHYEERLRESNPGEAEFESVQHD